MREDKKFCDKEETEVCFKAKDKSHYKLKRLFVMIFIRNGLTICLLMVYVKFYTFQHFRKLPGITQFSVQQFLMWKVNDMS